jgi:hypothetical protein
MSCNICFDRDGIERNCGCTAVYCDQCYDRLNECGVCRRDFLGRSISSNVAIGSGSIVSGNITIGSSSTPTSVTFGNQNLPVNVVGNPLISNSMPANLYLGVVRGFDREYERGRYIIGKDLYENGIKIFEANIEGQLVFDKSKMIMFILLMNDDEGILEWQPIERNILVW